jgi:hypothetical protein
VEKIMMLVGILATTTVTLAFTLGIGWALVTWWTASQSLPVADGFGHSGRSAGTALVIQAATEPDSLSAEYDWFFLHRPFDTITGERLVGEGGRVYHVLEVDTWTGGSREFWFDITEPFGHR